LMKKMLVISLFIILAMLNSLMVAVVLAEQGTAGGAAPELRFGVGARAFALGGAYGVIVNDATATYWNPAGLGALEHTNFNAMHSELFLGTNYDYLGWATPLKYGSIGLSYLRISTPGILIYKDSQYLGKDDASADVFYLGYGIDLRGWRVGITAKYLEKELPTASGSVFSVDLGIQRELTEELLLGITLQDIISPEIEWSNGYREEVPTNYRIGLAYKNNNWLVLYEYEKADDFSQGHLGFEYELNQYLTLRSGLREDDFTAGIGLKKDNYQFDYAYCAGDLGNTHRLSFAVDFIK